MNDYVSLDIMSHSLQLILYTSLFFDQIILILCMIIFFMVAKYSLNVKGWEEMASISHTYLHRNEEIN